MVLVVRSWVALFSFVEIHAWRSAACPNGPTSREITAAKPGRATVSWADSRLVMEFDHNRQKAIRENLSLRAKC
jgi:hypothetical protein